MKTLVAIPYDSVSANASIDFKPPNVIGKNVSQIASYNTNGIECTNKIEHAREKLVETFLRSDCEKILFIDSDTIVRGIHLLPLVESEHLVAVAIYPYRIYWDGKTPLPTQPTNISPILQAGLGCCCIHRKVFTIMEPPYFGRRGRVTDRGSEDWNFFRNLIRYKIDAYVYPDIRVGHQDRETGEIYYFSEDKKRTIKCQER